MTAAPATPRSSPSRTRPPWLPSGLLAGLRWLRARTHTARALLERPLTSYHLLVGSSALLVVLGLLMVLSASAVTSFAANGSSFTLLQRQAAWLAVGLPALLVAARLPPGFYRRVAYPLLFVSLAGLVLVFVPGLGETVNGARSWISLGGSVQLQPSEPAKIALVVWGADLLARKERLKLLGEWRHLLIPLLPGSGLMVLLVIMGNDLGTAFVLISLFLGLLWVAGAPIRLFTGMAGLMGLVVAILIMVEGYRMERVTQFLRPFEQTQGAGYQPLQALYALATGGLWGVGLGASREKWAYLPEAHTDFIFAIIGEELGLMGTLAVLVLFGVLGYAGFRVAGRTADSFTRFAAAGMTAWILIQACVNIGAVIGVLPVTGIPLPLVSYGGSSLVTTLVGIGILLSFARREPGAARALAARGPNVAARAFGWLGLQKGR